MSCCHEEVIFGVWRNLQEFPDSKLPTKAHSTDAGYDLYAAEKVTLRPGDRKIVKTGIHLQMQDGWEAQIRPRSGNAAKYGITVTNSPGTVDCSYCGMIMVILQNTGEQTFTVEIGDKIAQMVFQRIPVISLQEIQEKPTNETRGEKGFGSSGK